MNHSRLIFKTYPIALSTIFSALAVTLTLTNITIPFPFLPYLKFDFSEIPVTMSLYLIGPQYALLTTVIYWMILTIRAGELLGPAMKGAAVTSMILGFWIINSVKSKTANKKTIIYTGLALGMIVRIIVMSIFNYAVFMYIAPFYLDYAAGLIAAIGLPVATKTQVLLWTLILTGIYNLLHTLLSTLPSLFIAEASIDRVPSLAGSSWITQRGTPEENQ